MIHSVQEQVDVMAKEIQELKNSKGYTNSKTLNVTQKEPLVTITDKLLTKQNSKPMLNHRKLMSDVVQYPYPAQHKDLSEKAARYIDSTSNNQYYVNKDKAF